MFAQKKGRFNVFYDNFVNLCNKINKAPSAVAVEMGFQKSVVTRWKKNNSTPTDANLARIVDYFNAQGCNISVEFLIGQDKKDKPVTDDDELNAYLEELRTRPEMQMLFKLSKGATKEDVEQAVRIIEALQKKWYEIELMNTEFECRVTRDYANIRMVELPMCVEAVTHPFEDGTFDIYVNSQISPCKQLEALNHELNHIEKDHFYNECADIAYIEAEADLVMV